MKTLKHFSLLVLILFIIAACNKDDDTVTDPCNTSYNLGKIEIDDYVKDLFAYEGVQKLTYKNYDTGDELVYTIDKASHEFISKQDTFICNSATPDNKISISFEEEKIEYIFTAPYAGFGTKHIYASFATSFINPRDISIGELEDLSIHFKNEIYIEAGIHFPSIPFTLGRDCWIDLSIAKNDLGKIELEDRIKDSVRVWGAGETYYDVLTACYFLDPDTFLGSNEYKDLFYNKQLGLFSFIDDNNELWLLEKIE